MTARAVSDFLDFSVTKAPQEYLTHDEVTQWAGALDIEDFYNDTAQEIAAKYHRNKLSYTVCDRVMNDLWSAMITGLEWDIDQIPDPFYEVYLAFDAGEYHRKPDYSDDPVAEYTDPMIAELVTRLEL